MDRRGHFKLAVELILEPHSFLRKYQSPNLAAELILGLPALKQALAMSHPGKDRKDLLAAVEALVLHLN